jgi:hypothetical protein
MAVPRTNPNAPSGWAEARQELLTALLSLKPYSGTWPLSVPTQPQGAPDARGLVLLALSSLALVPS